MNEKKQKIVKNMLNVSMAVFVLYIVLGLVICLQPKIFLKSMLGYGEIILENSVLNFYQIGEFIVIGIVFILLWFLSKKKIFEHSSKSTILGVLNTIMAVSVCVVIHLLLHFYHIHMVMLSFSHSLKQNMRFYGHIRACKLC